MEDLIQNDAARQGKNIIYGGKLRTNSPKLGCEEQSVPSPTNPGDEQQPIKVSAQYPHKLSSSRWQQEQLSNLFFWLLMNLLRRITNFENICFGSHGREGVLGLVWDAPGAVRVLQPFSEGEVPWAGLGTCSGPFHTGYPLQKGLDLIPRTEPKPLFTC